MSNRHNASEGRERRDASVRLLTDSLIQHVISNTPPNLHFVYVDHLGNNAPPKTLWEKYEEIYIICHEKLLTKTPWENKEKPTYLTICITIASLKTFHEKPFRKNS